MDSTILLRKEPKYFNSMKTPLGNRAIINLKVGPYNIPSRWWQATWNLGSSIGVGTFFRTIGVDNILPGIFATSFHLLLSIIFLLITSYALRRFSIQFPYCSLRGYTFTIANWRKNHELMSGPRRPPPPRHCCHRLFSSKHR